MNKTDTAHLVPAVVFGGVLGPMLLASGASLGDAVLGLCAAYALVSLLEIVFELGKSTSAKHEP
jgi:hypothetical protein